MTSATTQTPSEHRAPDADDAPRGAPLPPPARRSTWSRKDKLVRLLWTTIARAVWVLVPPSRAALLRVFGATVGKGCVLPRSIEITIPWNITLGDHVRVSPGVILYSLGPITLGDACVLDRDAHLCAGSHDMRDSTFPLVRPPITLGRGCYVGFDAYVGPGVTLGDHTKVHPRASVYRDAPEGSVLRGNPAKPEEPET